LSIQTVIDSRGNSSSIHSQRPGEKKSDSKQSGAKKINGKQSPYKQIIDCDPRQTILGYIFRDMYEVTIVNSEAKGLNWICKCLVVEPFGLSTDELSIIYTDIL
jgi:hypothetical protein